jgi:hypothetical protein
MRITVGVLHTTIIRKPAQRNIQTHEALHRSITATGRTKDTMDLKDERKAKLKQRGFCQRKNKGTGVTGLSVHISHMTDGLDGIEGRLHLLSEDDKSLQKWVEAVTTRQNTIT